jgi:hypothetical protein
MNRKLEDPEYGAGTIRPGPYSTMRPEIGVTQVTFM